MKTDILVIGAGIYGISLANYLKAKNQSFIVVGRFMDLWRNHTFDDMTLRSDFPLSEIAHPQDRYSCEKFFKDKPQYHDFVNRHLPVSIFQEYLDWIEKKLEFEVHRDFVIHLEMLPSGEFEAEFQSGLCVKAKRVVIATGFGSHMYFPSELENFREKTIHSYQVKEILKVRNSKVLVIGAGQSAAECIEALTLNFNEVEWFHRGNPLYFEQPVKLPSWLFQALMHSPYGFHNLPVFLRQFLNQSIARATIMPRYRNLLSACKSTTEFLHANSHDKIIAATGFRFKIENLDFLSEGVKHKITESRMDLFLNKHFESPLKGLYFCGPVSEFSFGPVMKFIIGARYSSKQIALDIL